jgi:peptidoglycan/xylan/chitin deacetylase (PgdA/CDA1 family)
MEEGKHIQALGPLRTALALERNEPYGVIALGALYLHAGSLARAAREFERAHFLAPDEPLAIWGIALADLAEGKRDAKAFDAISPAAVPSAPLVAEYVRLLDGPAEAAASATKDVAPTEPDALRLEIAAFAALRGGDTDRGETLMKALVARPDMKILTEDRALILPFQTTRPAEGEAPSLPDAIGFPEPMGGYALTGRVTLSPPNGVPNGTAMITYSTPGGGSFTTTTNTPPFTAEWNTARFPNGLYPLRAVAYNASQKILSDVTRTVSLSNDGAPLPALLTDTERIDFHRRLLELLTPRVCRKAAHYALAERAQLQGDQETAENESEAVVAIDPAFGDSLAKLHQYHEDLLAHPASYWRGITNEKIVALTFDDGPNPAPAHTPALLDALKRAKVHATFFVVGARAEQCTDILQRMTVDGHEVANHSYSHANLTYLDHAALERELCRTSVIIRDATGIRPKFYRPPGGNYNSAVVDAAGALGMAGAYWTIDGLKFETDPFTPQRLTQYVLGLVRPGAIILMHNAPENTIQALPAIVAGLRARGYEMLTMTELAKRCHAGGTTHPGAMAQR